MKIHLLASDDPLKEGTDLKAICGQMVTKAGFVYMQDTAAMENLMDWGTFRNCCYRCLKVPLVGRRIYAVMDGQDHYDFTHKTGEP